MNSNRYSGTVYTIALIIVGCLSYWLTINIFRVAGIAYYESFIASYWPDHTFTYWIHVLLTRYIAYAYYMALTSALMYPVMKLPFFRLPWRQSYKYDWLIHVPIGVLAGDAIIYWATGHFLTLDWLTYFSLR